MNMKKYASFALMLTATAIVSAAVSTAVYKYNQHPDAPRVTMEETSLPPNGATDQYGFINTAQAFTQDNRVVGNSPDLIPAAEASVHAVVHIKVQGEQQVQRGYIDPFEFFFGGGGMEQPRTQPIMGSGSGVIISSDGYIITNNHVIDDANKIEVTLNDNRTFKGTLVGSDPDTDIALIKIEATGLTTLPFGNSDELHLGEWVLAVGNPFDLTSTVTAGIVSAKARPAAQSGRGGDMKIGGFIQVDAAVNPGNSGGALVNAKGELVGINTMIYSQTGNFTGYAFAVPINTAAKVVSDIRKYGTVQRAVLGIVGGDVNSQVKEEKGLKVNEGVYVADFAEVSSAYAAGIEKEDVIVAINGRNTRSMAELQSIIAMHRPGDKVQITVDRKGSRKEFSVTLKNMEGGQTLLTPAQGAGKELLGATLAELSSSEKRSFGINYGVQVKKVGNGRMKKAGVKEDFVILSINETPIRNITEAKKQLAKAQGRGKTSQSILLKGFYPREGRVRYYTID